MKKTSKRLTNEQLIAAAKERLLKRAKRRLVSARRLTKRDLGELDDAIPPVTALLDLGQDLNSKAISEAAIAVDRAVMGAESLVRFGGHLSKGLLDNLHGAYKDLLELSRLCEVVERKTIGSLSHEKVEWDDVVRARARSDFLKEEASRLAGLAAETKRRAAAEQELAEHLAGFLHLIERSR